MWVCRFVGLLGKIRLAFFLIYIGRFSWINGFLAGGELDWVMMVG